MDRISLIVVAAGRLIEQYYTRGFGADLADELRSMVGIAR